MWISKVATHVQWPFVTDDANNGNPTQDAETPLISSFLQCGKPKQERSQKSGSFKNFEGNFNTALNNAKMN